MKMSNHFVCCERCFETIAKKSTTAAKLWLDLCAIKLAIGEIVSFRGQDFAALRSLEIMGYICSTERLDHILIKIHGHRTTENGQDFFCLDEDHFYD